MSRKTGILGLVLTAALTILLSGLSPGQASEDPCGGHYVGEGLKAKFLSAYDETSCSNGVCNIQNDVDAYYQYQVPGGDCVFHFRAGHVIVGVGNSGRPVVIHFQQVRPGGTDCPSVPYTICYTESFMLRTDVGFTASRGYGNDTNILVLTSTNARLNFGAMTPGETYYCQTSIKFRVAGDPAEYQHHFQAKVTYGYVGGILKWVITPINEPYGVRTVTKVGKKLIPSDPPTWHESSVFAQIGSDYCGDYGTYCLPFKLILERLP